MKRIMVMALATAGWLEIAVNGASIKAVRMALDWVIEHKAAFDFLGHPSCLYVTDPDYRAIELICEQVKKAGPKAAIPAVALLAAWSDSSGPR